MCVVFGGDGLEAPADSTTTTTKPASCGVRVRGIYTTYVVVYAHGRRRHTNNILFIRIFINFFFFANGRNRIANIPTHTGVYDLYNTIIIHDCNCIRPSPLTLNRPRRRQEQVKINRFFFFRTVVPYFFLIFFCGFCRCFHPTPPPYYEIIIITLLYPYQLSTHGRSAKEPLPPSHRTTIHAKRLL